MWKWGMMDLTCMKTLQTYTSQRPARPCLWSDVYSHKACNCKQLSPNAPGEINKSDLQSRSISHTDCCFWMGRGRAWWRSPPADKGSRYTCRTSPRLWALQGSWAHLRITQQQRERTELLRSQGFRMYPCILDSTAEGRPLGCRRAQEDTWWCYISRDLSERLKEQLWVCTLSIRCSLWMWERKYLCTDAAHAEHEPKGLQIGMPAVSWVICPVFESTNQPRACSHKEEESWGGEKKQKKREKRNQTRTPKEQRE